MVTLLLLEKMEIVEVGMPIDGYYVGIIGNVIMFVVGFGAGCLFPKKERDLTNLTVWTQDGSPLV